MNGHGSDLRTGLPLQMVEIHEAMRLLLIVDAAVAPVLGLARMLDRTDRRMREVVTLDGQPEAPTAGALRYGDST